MALLIVGVLPKAGGDFLERGFIGVEKIVLVMGLRCQIGDAGLGGSELVGQVSDLSSAFRGRAGELVLFIRGRQVGCYGLG